MGMTLATAEVVSTWANWILLVSLLVGVAATYFIVVTADIKETALKLSVSANELATERAREGAAQANAAASAADARAADAIARSEESKLELAKLKTPRTLSEEQQARIEAKIKPFAGTQFMASVANDAESTSLLPHLLTVLEKAGWVHKPWPGTVSYVLPNRAPISITMLEGIFVQGDIGHFKTLSGPVEALANALKAEGLIAQGQIGVLPESMRLGAEDKDKVLVQLGAKPK